MNKQQARKVITERRKGFYKTDDTTKDVEVSLRNMKKDDLTIFLHRNSGLMMVMNLKELLPQMKIWKELKCRVMDYNTREIEVGREKVWLWVLQPEVVDETTPICPMCLAYGVMVSGFGYISRDKGVPEMVQRYLTPKTESSTTERKEEEQTNGKPTENTKGSEEGSETKSETR